MNVKQLMAVSLLTLPLTVSNLSFAQGDNNQNQDNAHTNYQPRWVYGISIGTLNFDKESSAREFIDSSADFTLGFSADYSTQRWLTSIGLDWVSYDDNAGFTQRTENAFSGRESDSSSDADGILLSLAFGPQWRFGEGEKASVFLQAGASTMIASERSISNCSNCYSEDIDIDGGVFAKAGLMYQTGEYVAIGVNAVQYLSSDDLENGFNFVVRFTPGSRRL